MSLEHGIASGLTTVLLTAGSSFSLFFLSLVTSTSTTAIVLRRVGLNENGISRLQRHETSRDVPCLPFAGGNSNDRSNDSMNATTSSSSTAKANNVEMVVIDVLLTTGFCLVLSMIARQLTKVIGNSLRENAESDQAVKSGTRLEKTGNSLLHERMRENHVNMKLLTTYERQVADSIIDPTTMEYSFADMGGVDDIKEQVYRSVVTPLIFPHVFHGSKLRQAPMGILLYGQPGTGKTMMAKCIAKEARAILIPLNGSTLLNKYWGESNKIVAAAFGLAQKLAPAILFIDELDNFLRAGGGGGNGDSGLMDSIKAEFLTLWDGVGTTPASRVLVVGATNRPERIDTAILRRMPRPIELPLPNEASRLDILKKLLSEETCHASVASSLPDIALRTNMYSGSDLHEVCKHAANMPAWEVTEEYSRRRVMGETMDSFAVEAPTVRPLHADDLYEGIQRIRPTGAAAFEYGQRQAGPAHNTNNNNNNAAANQLLRMLQQLAENDFDEVDANNDDVPTL